MINLLRKLIKVKGLKGRELNFEIKTNINEINRVNEPIVDMEKEIEEILSPYNEEAQEALKEACTVDGKVSTKIVNGNEVYDIPEDKMSEYEVKVKELIEKHKTQIEDYGKQKADFIKFLNDTDSKFEISTIKKHYIPEDISTEDMDLIWDLVKVESK